MCGAGIDNVLGEWAMGERETLPPTCTPGGRGRRLKCSGRVGESAARPPARPLIEWGRDLKCCGRVGELDTLQLTRPLDGRGKN